MLNMKSNQRGKHEILFIQSRKREVEGIKEHYKKFGDKLPKELSAELAALEERLNKA